jgi:dienelactone hydrolase
MSGLTDLSGITDVSTEDRVRDLVFVLDELARWNTNDVVLAGRLDLTRVAAMGGCWGATVAPEFCRIDDRCKAAVILDGTPSMAGGDDVLKFSLQKPFLSIYHAGNTERTLFDEAIHDAIRFEINGVEHDQIVDDVLYWVWYTDLPAGREAARTINAYSLWFLNKYLKGSNAPMPATADYPLILNFQQK